MKFLYSINAVALSMIVFASTSLVAMEEATQSSAPEAVNEAIAKEAIKMCIEFPPLCPIALFAASVDMKETTAAVQEKLSPQNELESRLEEATKMCSAFENPNICKKAVKHFFPPNIIKSCIGTVSKEHEDIDERGLTLLVNAVAGQVQSVQAQSASDNNTLPDSQESEKILSSAEKKLNQALEVCTKLGPEECNAAAKETITPGFINAFLNFSARKIKTDINPKYLNVMTNALADTVKSATDEMLTDTNKN